MRDVRQPVLIVHGELDTQVPAGNADRLEQLAGISLLTQKLIP
jgi:dipeptidyl aminopeptidase/acylaminoacyl peptidase